jgi:hypothetical protein
MLLALAVFALNADPSPAAPSVERTHAVLEAVADDAHDKRIASVVSTGTIAAGMIGAGIVYIAVSHADTQLSKQDVSDTQNGGFVVLGASIVPIAVTAAELFVPSDAEVRRDQFERTHDVAATVAGLHQDADAPPIARDVAGGALIAAGAVSAGLGALWLLLPHIDVVRSGPVAHATGAELIGTAVASAGSGVALFVFGDDSARTASVLLAAP